MPRVRVEFTVEPFVDGRPGAHVLAAWSAVESSGVWARDGAATIAVPGDMGGMAGAAPAVADVTVPMQAQAIQNRVRDQTNAVLQKGADRSNASQP